MTTKQEKAVFKKVMREIGAKGGKVTAQRLTPEERRERARQGGLAKARKAQKL